MEQSKTTDTGGFAFNSVQLNLVTFVDIYNTNANQSLDGNVFMMDNCLESTGQGTDHLQTVCKQGQILNWLIFAMDSGKRPDGTFPPFAKINNIVLLNESGTDVASDQIFREIKIIGGPDKIRSKYTSVYYYWAGALLADVPVGVYKYRFVLEVGTEDPAKKNYFNLNTPSLKIVPVA
ncbi:hypothetical protein HNQ91_001692 [Filimonas zeae]|uniref:Uncharacterized protein n=1 Tax=Filimonas zeae TaxID=1737353 RepID=A0A917IX42_9BACT|nr:hypothetical protein [Filimonas zeae]MDR6338641.1 hypothetical protein [Filimonas zeae]GGH67262.1 hypothetical protein GCM10011379_22350 [Filimonas zeae]